MGAPLFGYALDAISSRFWYPDTARTTNQLSPVDASTLQGFASFKSEQAIGQM